jgi:hypothetical protein
MKMEMEREGIIHSRLEQETGDSLIIVIHHRPVF